MREIEFRGKRKDNGEWQYGYYGQLTDGEINKSYIITNTLTFIPHKSIYFTDAEIIPETVGQFTGLLDCNGKKIYDKDIIRDHNGTGIVMYDEKFCAWKVVYIGELKGQSKWFIDYNLPGEVESIKVIGNIFNNPE